MDAKQAFSLGVKFLERNEVEMAALAFSQAIVLDPNSAQAFNGRSVAFAMKDDLAKALADCEEAIRLDPHDPEFYRTRGHVYIRMGRDDDGAADFAKADHLDGA